MPIRSLLGLLLLFPCACSNGLASGDDGGVSSNDASAVDASLQFTDATTDVSTPNTCSSDLHSVLDGNGEVVTTCASDQGCSNGQCVAACDAVAQKHGSVGCDYVVSTPSYNSIIKPPCFAVYVANNWGADLQIGVQRDGQTYDVTQFGRIAQTGQPETAWAPVPATGVPSGEVAVLFMSDDPKSLLNVTIQGLPLTCPITPAIEQTGGTAISGAGTQGANLTGLGKAWHITTTLPTTAYDILPYGRFGDPSRSYFPSANLLFPTTSWGTNYLGIVPTRATTGPQWGQLIAASDNTQVTVYPNVDLPSGPGVAAAPAQMKTTYSLNAGDYIEWQDSNDMTGTIVESNNPTAFVGGQTMGCYTSSTSTGGRCDSAHQSMPPISALSNEYAVAPYTTRRADLMDEAIPYRIVAAAAGTNLQYQPSIPGAPTTLQAGEAADFTATGPFIVNSQDLNHPFFIAQMMTGYDVTGGSRPGCFAPFSCEMVDGKCCLGASQFVDVVAPAQYLSSYVFFADPTYATTNLVVTRKHAPNAGFQDVTLDCAGKLSGWQPIGTSGEYQFTNIDLLRANVPNGQCNNGPHAASSAGPFGITVWGMHQFASYAYAAGGYVAPLNPVVLMPPN